MKPAKIENTTDLKNQFSNEELFQVFKEQISKDFSLTGIDIDKNLLTFNPKELYQYIQEEITYLIDNNFEKLLSLLYRIDIPEDKIIHCIKSTGQNQDIYSNITFLILKRIWIKIWYRFNY